MEGSGVISLVHFVVILENTMGKGNIKLRTGNSKIAILILVCLLALLFMSACSSSSKMDKALIDETIQNFFGALNEGDYDKALLYFTSDSDITSKTMRVYKDKLKPGSIIDVLYEKDLVVSSNSAIIKRYTVATKEGFLDVEIPIKLKKESDDVWRITPESFFSKVESSNSVDQESHPSADKVLSEYLTNLQDYNFDAAEMFYSEESLISFNERRSSVLNSLNEENYELVKFEIIRSEDVKYDYIEKPAKLVVAKVEVYEKGKKSERNDGYILTYDKEKGWQISYGMYLASKDLGFKESRVTYSTKDQYTNVGQYIKVAPRKIIYSYSKTYVGLEFLTNFENKGNLNFFTSPKGVKTKFILEATDNVIYEGIFDSGEMSKATIGNSQRLINTKPIIIIGEGVKTLISPKNMYIEDFVQRVPYYGNYLYEISILQNGNYLNEQKIERSIK